ncbi:fatty acid cis/trans isomerase CTI [Alteromonadaceae bacterium 2753L.S.0a.02]|nr:fatty acid cis/trans isomerase CTI [Alteromonadaceae bacterium 2753L.S.0a.02]
MFRFKRGFKALLTGLFILFVSGCATFGGMKLYDLYGPSEPRNREVSTLPVGHVDYWRDVSPILENRCVVCHGCYDAPCQLKLGSIEGIDRGATSELVYANRIFEADPTRLFIDAQSTAGWRDKSFHPVLNEHNQTPEANRRAGVMYQLLQLKTRNPLPQQAVLGEAFEFGIDRELTCPKEDEVDRFAEKHPLWGMPYALPGLNPQEQNTLEAWLEQGATHTARQALPVEYHEAVAQWEQFLNQDSLKGRLVSRYLYEHLFLANLYFDALDHRRVFKLVRSSTPPGQPIDVIPSRRPYDDPGVERVYYRLREYNAAIVAKTHMPYALSAARRQRWQQLFFDADYVVDKLPGYDPEFVANPFVQFFQIPVTSRYQFMLDEAQYTVMGFIKGPVCRGQVALNVINDHFWVLFVKPDETQNTIFTDFIRENYATLEIPTEKGSIFRPLSAWRKYSKKQREFLSKRDEYLVTQVSQRVKLNTDLIWDGDGTNDNAALTVFRHFDSATVEKGLIGGEPDTTWIMGYSDIERIHYLLVAGYDVYGNLGHQLLSRLYMDFLRMESEANYLLLLPQETRKALRAKWYRGADEELMQYLQSPEFEAAHRNPDIAFTSDDPERELRALIHKKLAPVLSHKRDLSELQDTKLKQSLLKLNDLPGLDILQMPESANILIETDQGDQFFTLLKNKAHLNMTSMFGEQDNRVPEEDNLVILRGFVGSYPNVFFKLKQQDAEEFVNAVAHTANAQDYKALLDQFGVRRTDPLFWTYSDRVHEGYRQSEPDDYGLLDYNRIENR